ncbi:MAG: TIGR00730 family Rossman fold protein [Acidimicrobiia bacterium]
MSDSATDPTRSVCVYCGSSSGSDPRYAALASDLGRELARRDVGLVYGGGRIGLMGLVADGVLDHGGRVHGVIPEHLVRAETAHVGLDRLDVVTSMHERKARMAELSDGFVVLPGGFGTLDEVFEILTWNQLGLIAKPVVFLNVADYFSPLAVMIDHMIEAGFVRETLRPLVNLTDDVARAVDIATGPAPEVDGKLRDLDVTSKRSAL